MASLADCCSDNQRGYAAGGEGMLSSHGHDLCSDLSRSSPLGNDLLTVDEFLLDCPSLDGGPLKSQSAAGCFEATTLLEDMIKASDAAFHKTSMLQMSLDEAGGGHGTLECNNGSVHPILPGSAFTSIDDVHRLLLSEDADQLMSPLDQIEFDVIRHNPHNPSPGDLSPSGILLRDISADNPAESHGERDVSSHAALDPNILLGEWEHPTSWTAMDSQFEGLGSHAQAQAQTQLKAQVQDQPQPQPQPQPQAHAQDQAQAQAQHQPQAHAQAPRQTEQDPRELQEAIDPTLAPATSVGSRQLLYVGGDKSEESRPQKSASSSGEAPWGSEEGYAAPEAKQQRRGRDLSGRLAALVREVEEAERSKAERSKLRPEIRRNPAESRREVVATVRSVSDVASFGQWGQSELQNAHGAAQALPWLPARRGKRNLRSLLGFRRNGLGSAELPWGEMQRHLSGELRVPRTVLQPSDSACVATRGVDRMRQHRLQALILALAQACAEKDKVKISSFLSRLDAEASPSGDPMQRCALHFCRALQARANATGAAAWREPLPHSFEEVLNAMGGAIDLPSVSVGFHAMAGVLSRMLIGHRRVHVIGLGHFLGPHWSELFSKLASQPGGPPDRVRVTAVELLSHRWTCLPGGVVRLGGPVLMQMAGEFWIALKFEEVVSEVECFNPHLIRVEEGEALAVVSLMSLFLLPEETILRSNPRSSFLKWVCDQKPAVFLLSETHASATGPFFMNRVKDLLRSSVATFEVLDSVYPRQNAARKICELLIAREISNCIACEGLERQVRHEVLEMWQHRLQRVGFVPLPLGEETWERMRDASERLDARYSIVDVDGAARLSWCGNPVQGISAWF